MIEKIHAEYQHLLDEHGKDLAGLSKLLAGGAGVDAPEEPEEEAEEEGEEDAIDAIEDLSARDEGNKE